jgi:predicted membrane protein
MKADRASVVGDAIEYIKELLRTVNELKLLVEKKRCGRERTEADDVSGDVESCNMKPLGDPEQSYNGSLRSSWLQRKSKETEVDVRIIDDEVTIKLLHPKNNCLLFVSKVLDELQLDLHHLLVATLAISTASCSTPRYIYIHTSFCLSISHFGLYHKLFIIYYYMCMQVHVVGFHTSSVVYV